jgi:uncharacterized caspase-like protein
MASNWAIVIGVNQYRFLQPLKYAMRDAEAMNGFLIEEAKFDRIFLFTDDSPEIGGKPTEPFRANLLRVLRQIFVEPFMKDGDNFWFFFSGHGIPHNGQDYLMPLDGDPEDIENTGISTNTITNYLRSCGADNAVMILDACRSGGKKSGEGIGKRTETESRQTGVISLFSCSPDQYSYELETFRHGAFTYALLEALGVRGKCATVERLNQYLEHRVPELVNQHFQRVRQTPYTIAEPLDRCHLILMPKFANPTDIGTLKNDAYRAQMKQDWDLAQRLWIRVNAATSGQDMDAISALQNLGISRNAKLISPIPKTIQSLEHYKASTNPGVESRSSSLNQSNQASVSRQLTRQQFLKWAVPTGIGAIGVTIISQFLGRSPQPSLTPDSPTSPKTSVSQPLQPSPTSIPDTPHSSQPTALPTSPTSNSIPVEYSKLDSFLKAKDWKAANDETFNLMKMKGGIALDSFKGFPCEVLSQIDRLWVDSSNGRYGFSVQTKIYLEGSCSKSDQQILECFSNSVGWTMPGKKYEAFFGQLVNYPGHFPYISVDGEDGAYNQLQRFGYILKRLVSCRI